MVSGKCHDIVDNAYAHHTRRHPGLPGSSVFKVFAVTIYDLRGECQDIVHTFLCQDIVHSLILAQFVIQFIYLFRVQK